MPQPVMPPRSASVSELLDAATRVFRGTLAKGLPVALFAMLAAALPDMYWMTTGAPMDLLHPPRDPKFWVLSAVGFAAYQLLAAMLMLRQRALLQGLPPSLTAEFAEALGRWPLLLVGFVLGGLAVFIGTLALIVPGLFLLVCFLLLRPVLLFETLDPLAALRRCLQLVKPMWVKVLAAALIAALIFVICVVAASAVLGIVQAIATAAGSRSGAWSAFVAACTLGIQAVALVYFNALWLVLYSAASSSA